MHENIDGSMADLAIESTEHVGGAFESQIREIQNRARPVELSDDPASVEQALAALPAEEPEVVALFFAAVPSEATREAVSEGAATRAIARPGAAQG